MSSGAVNLVACGSHTTQRSSRHSCRVTHMCHWACHQTSQMLLCTACALLTGGQYFLAATTQPCSAASCAVVSAPCEALQHYLLLLFCGPLHQPCRPNCCSSRGNSLSLSPSVHVDHRWNCCLDIMVLADAAALLFLTNNTW